MKTLSLFKKALLICAAMLFFYACGEKKNEKQPDTLEATENEVQTEANYKLASADTPATPCDCDSSWFPHTQTPAPLEGANSPFAASETTNCIFHQWSWQKFLWLTVPDATSSKTPFFLRDADITQVDPYMNPVKIPTGVSIALSTKEAEQAGSSAILESNPNFNTNGVAGTVFYAIYMNSTMNTAAKQFATGLNNGTIQPSNSEAFPVGSFELKTSWIPTSVIPTADLANYYTTKASIDGTTVEVAMLGMHVVGVVENHPEFIWATFEHNNLAPAFDWTKGTASSDTETLLFKKGSVSTIDGIKWTGTSMSEAYTLFEYGVPRIKGAPMKNFMTTSQLEPENYNNIKTIDHCVAGKLTDVWNNYAYTGSIWVNTDGLSPAEQIALLKKEGYGLGSATPGSVARGSLNSANISMETYTQTFNSNIESIDASNLVNCLSCHSAVSFSDSNATSPLYISHVFNGYLEHQKGTSETEIKQMKVKEFQQTFIEKKKE